MVHGFARTENASKLGEGGLAVRTSCLINLSSLKVNSWLTLISAVASYFA